VRGEWFDLWDDSLKFELSENSKINLWQVNYTIDESGLIIDFEKAWIVKSPSFSHDSGEGGISMNGRK
jgi:hypothetical protein